MEESGNIKHATAIISELQQSENASAVEHRDALFSALADGRRRFVIGALESCGGSLALADLAAEVADRDEGTDASVSEHVRRVEIELYHVHVPKLAAVGLVQFDRDRNVVWLPGQSRS